MDCHQIPTRLPLKLPTRKPHLEMNTWPCPEMTATKYVHTRSHTQPNTHWDTPSAYQPADSEPLTNIRTSCSNLVFRWSLVGSLKSDECRGMKENGFDAISSWMIWPSTNWHWAKLKSRLLVSMVGEGGASLTADLHLR